jgi:hypothetical protein
MTLGDTQNFLNELPYVEFIYFHNWLTISLDYLSFEKRKFYNRRRKKGSKRWRNVPFLCIYIYVTLDHTSKLFFFSSVPCQIQIGKKDKLKTWMKFLIALSLEWLMLLLLSSIYLIHVIVTLYIVRQK